MNEIDLRKLMKLIHEQSKLSEQELLALDRATTLPDPETLTPWALMVFWGPRLVKALRAQWKRNTDLQRRCQLAESAARTTLEKVQRQGSSLSRGLLQLALLDAQRRIAELEAELGNHGATSTRISLSGDRRVPR
jgi:hypothetical protein